MAALAALVILLYTTMTLQGFLSAEKERRRTRAMFGRYVSPAVMEELLKNPDLAVLGGQRREVTILFVDIRGFTSYSENKPPEEVVARLNTYLNEMTKLIFQYGGTLDKYLGDGLMAVFGAPLELEGHAAKAVACARNPAGGGRIKLRVAGKDGAAAVGSALTPAPCWWATWAAKKGWTIPLSART